VLSAYTMVLSDGSGSGEGMYSGQQCTWLIFPTSDTTTTGGESVGVYVFFTRFDMRSGASLTFYNGPVADGKVLQKITANSNSNSNVVSALPTPLTFNVSSVGVLYTTAATASAVVGNGFSMTYVGVPSSGVAVPGDGVIRMYAASDLSLTSMLGNTAISSTSSGSTGSSVTSNVTWSIAPSGLASSDIIYISAPAVAFSQPDSCLHIHNSGSSGNGSGLMYNQCGGSGSGSVTGSSYFPAPYQWLQTTSRTALVTFTPTASAAHSASDAKAFDLAYFTTAASSYHCGFAKSPAVITEPSWIISDGSAKGATMQSGQACEWVIQPNTADGNDVGVDADRSVVLEFLESDLRGGGRVEVFDGASDGDRLLWRCDGCKVI
jgi:hypothetical protein